MNLTKKIDNYLNEERIQKEDVIVEIENGIRLSNEINKYLNEMKKSTNLKQLKQKELIKILRVIRNIKVVTTTIGIK